MVIEEECDSVAWVGPADPSFTVTYLSKEIAGKSRYFFQDESGAQYMIGFNWDWSHPYPRLDEKWRVGVQTVKAGETYVLPYGSEGNPFPKSIRADHPRAQEIAGCWKYSTYFSLWMHIQAIEMDEQGTKLFASSTKTAESADSRRSMEKEFSEKI